MLAGEAAFVPVEGVSCEAYRGGGHAACFAKTANDRNWVELRVCLRGFGEALGARAPVPRHELVPARGRPVAGDLLGDVGDIGLRVDVVELGGLDDGVESGGTLTAGL